MGIKDKYRQNNIGLWYEKAQKRMKKKKKQKILKISRKSFGYNEKSATFAPAIQKLTAR